MALRKLIYVDEYGQLVELDTVNDSVKIKELELGASVLSEAKLAKLIDGADASDEHIHDARYFRQDQFIAERDEVEGLGTPIKSDLTTGYLSNTFIDPSVASQLSHSDMLDLDADDHTQYLKVDGLRAMSADLNMDDNNIINLPLPTLSHQAASKAYVDSVAEGLSIKPAVKAATVSNLAGTYQNGTLGVGATLNLGPSATLSIDGVTTWAQYDGILVKAQTNKAHNGRYYVSQVGGASTDWILTRCGYCDEASEIPSAYIFVQQGTQFASTGWVAEVGISLGSNPNAFEVGFDLINWFQFSGVGTFLAGAGLFLDGNEFNVGRQSNGGVGLDIDNKLFVQTSDLIGEGLVIDGSDDIAIDWSSTYDDAKAIKAADLSSTADGKGASIIGVEDQDGFFTAENVEGVLREIWIALDEAGGVKHTAVGAINKGDLLIMSGNDSVSTYSDLSVDSPVIGVAFKAALNGALVKAVNIDFQITGILSGATAGTRYFWNGSGFQTTLPTTNSANCYQVGIAKNATDLLVGIKFIKKNAAN